MFSVFNCAVLTLKYDLNYTLYYFQYSKTANAYEKYYLHSLLHVVDHQGKHNQINSLADCVFKEREKLPDMCLVEFKFHHYKQGEQRWQNKKRCHNVLIGHWGRGYDWRCNICNGVRLVFGRGDRTEVGEPEERREYHQKHDVTAKDTYCVVRSDLS